MKFYTTLIIALFFTITAHAYHDVSINSKTGSAIVIGAANLVPCEDPETPTYTSPSWVNQMVTNVVYVEIDQSNSVFIGSPYHARFSIEINGLDASGFPMAPNVIDLDLQYDPYSGNKYVDKHAYEFSGYHKIEIKVLSITDVNTGLAITTPFDNMRVGARIDIERYAALNTLSTVSGVSSTPIDADSDLVPDHLDISWTPMAGAEEYDLEWTFINDYGNSASGTPYLTPSPSVLSYTFKNNSTRVRISDASYKISLLFNHGYVVYRVRAVGRSLAAVDKLLFTDWTIAENDYIYYLSSSDYYWNQNEHEPSKSWQYSATYAEEGKNKEIVNYYDGAYKSRQIVTKTRNGGVENTIVGESIYDYQWRPAVQVLPSPTLSSAAVIKFYENFNLDDSLKPYSRNDFDHDLNDCEANLTGMHIASGASQYYSSNNTNQNYNNAFIPDAQHYPFTQVEYTPDNTGRIRKQSGVGLDHQIGTGHETKYFYGQPTQKQLDRLFGSEAGYNRHYKKNLVVDANGQTSVSYLDNAGRVVATALSGSVPGNLAAIPSEATAGDSLVEDLFAKDADGVSQTNYINQEFDAIVFNTEVLVPTPGDYQFNYTVTAPSLTEYCAANNLTLCFDCVYDLEIIIKDPCGQVLTPGYDPITVKIGEVDGGGDLVFDEVCSSPYTYTVSPSPLTISFSEVGNYTISKVLKINKTAFDEYFELYLIDNVECVKDFEYFQTQERAKIDTTDCHIDCEKCVELLGTKDSYILSGKGTEEDWQAEYDNCMLPCAEYNMCEAVYATLLSDISPGGQYAQYFDPKDESINTTNFPLSVLNESNKLPLGSATANWKNPSVYVAGVWENMYLNADGTRTKIRLYKAADNSMWPDADYVYTDEIGSYTYPEFLTGVDDFIKYWQPSWAKSLVKYHPEYCYYEWCILNDSKDNTLLISSNTFDGRISNIDAYSVANSNGYLADPLTDIDPYFITGGVGASQKAEMDAKMANYYGGLSMKQVASYWAKCGNRYEGTIGAINSVCIDFNDASASTEKKNKEWSIYRSLYLSEKQRLQNALRTDYVLSSSGCRKYNGCIGNENFNPYASAMVNYMDVSYDAFHDPEQPCAAETYALYKTKIRRFFYDETVPNLDEDETNYNLFMETGQCPLASELEGLMDWLAKTVTWGHAPYMTNSTSSTYNIYKEVVGEPLPSVWHQIKTETIVLMSGDLRIAFWDSISGYYPCFIEFQIPTGSSFIWSQVKGFKQLKVVNEVSGTYYFEIIAMVDDDSNPSTPEVEKHVTGHTCMPIGGCSFKNKCEVNETVSELQVLMSELAKGGDLASTTAVNLETYTPVYKSFVTDNIRRLVSYTDFFNPITWRYDNVNDKFVLEQISTSDDADINILGYDPAWYTSAYTLADIKYFLNVRIDFNNPDQLFIDGYYDDDSNPATPDAKVTLTLKIKNGAFELGTCGLPTPLACKTIEHKNKEDLEQLLKDIITPGINYINTDLRAYPTFSSRLKSYLGEGRFSLDINEEIPAPHISDDGKTMRLPIIDSNNVMVCEIVFTLDDSSTYDFNDITDLDNMTVLGQEMTNGRSYGFTMVATFSYTDMEVIHGVSSCFPIRQCDPCFNKNFDCDISYIEYKTAVDNYNSTYAPGGETDPYYLAPVDMEEFYDSANSLCACFDYYIHYLNNYNPEELDAVAASIFGYDCSGDDPLPEPSSESEMCEEAINTINNAIGLHNNRLNDLLGYSEAPSSPNWLTTISDPFWFYSLNMCDCVDDYVAYIQSFTDEQLLENTKMVYTVAEYNEAFPCKRNLPKCFPSGPSEPFVSLTAAWVSPCLKEMQAIADINALSLYGQYKDSLRSEFRKRYYETCLGAFEEFSMTYYDKEYHYTLYYYDQAGSLIRTVPPEGVRLVTNSGDFTKINQDRTYKTRTFFTSHILTTTYEFNSLNQLVRQSVPDHDKMDIWVPENTNSLPTGFVVMSNHFVTRSKGYLAGKIGTDGYIYKTEDGGNTWQRITDVESSTLNKIFMTTSNTGYAVGEDGMLYKTTNNGAQWKILPGLFGSNVRLNDLYFKDNLNGVVVGDGGYIRKTTDGGSTWSTVSVSPTISGNITSVSFVDTDTDKGYLTIDNSGAGAMYKTTDFGSNWSATTDIRTQDLYKVQMVDANKGYASYRGGILKTTNGGTAWQQVNTNITVLFFDFYFKDENNGLAVEESGKLYRTSDGGVTWALANALGVYRNLYINNSYTYGLAVGDFGLVSKVKLSDLSIINGTSGNTADNYAGAYVFDNSTAFIAGSDGKVYKTTNFSANNPAWSLIATSSGMDYFVKMYVNSATTPLLALLNDNGEVYKLSGTTFTLISGSDVILDFQSDGTNLYMLNVLGSGEIQSISTSLSGSPASVVSLAASVSGGLRAMCVQGTNTRFAVGANGDIFKNTSSSYTNYSTATIPSKLNHIEAQTGIAYAVGDNGGVYKYDASGNLWTKLDKKTTKNLLSVDFWDASTGVFADESGVMYYTANGGTSITAASTLSTNINDIRFVSSTDAYAAAANGKVYKTTNAGASWALQTVPLGKTGTGFNGIHSTSTTNIIACGTNGRMLAYNGTSWSWLGNFVTNEIKSIHVNGTVGYGGGVSGLLLTSANSGATWTVKPPVAYPLEQYNAAWAVSSTQGIVAGTGGKVRYTANSGSTWSLVYTGAATMNGVHFTNATTGYIVGNSGLMAKTTNGGVSWSDVTSYTVTTENLNAVFGRNEHIMAVGDDGTIVTSDDAVTSTCTLPLPGTDEHLRDVYMHDYYTAYAVGENGIIKKTIDGGTIWTTKTSNTFDHINTIYFGGRYFGHYGGENILSKTVRDEADIFSMYLWYDRLGRVSVSQNTKQFNKTTPAYSYTKFDDQGRVIEIGENATNVNISSVFIDAQIDDVLLDDWVVNSVTRTEVIQTFYDEVVVGFLPIVQTNLRKQIAMTTYSETYDPDPNAYDYATHYSYDVHGTVSILLHDNPSLSYLNQQYKTIEYDYDLVGGNVNALYYQRGEADQYTHYYTYDADNKITDVYTSRSGGILKDHDARYLYYDHGPLARMETGDLQVQGTDYAYTIQGWLKGVNSDMLDANLDMGKDGEIFTGSINENFARDVYAFSLGYYVGDYYSVNGALPGGSLFLADVTGSGLLAARNDLFNGNISHMVTSLTEVGPSPVLNRPWVYGYAYQYDQLNRLVHMESNNDYDAQGNTWKSAGTTGAYEVSLTYDANGNILTLDRNGEDGNLNMDNLSYQYDWINNDPAQGLRSNRLYHVNDGITSTYTTDIDDQGTFTPASSVNDINALNNYGYDELGNLIRDDAEEIATIEWTVYGKIKSITRTGSSTASNLIFKYDAQGRRIEKREIPYGGADIVTYYVYDATGNLIATYSHHQRDDDNNEYDGEEMFICNSHIIYGSSRLGIDARPDTLVGHLIDPKANGYHTRLLGSKQYENSNHLENVLVTISDIKIPVDDNTDFITDYYVAHIISEQDYYPFGSIMPGRTWGSDSYRFGFNGKEKDNEVKGAGNSLDFGARVYDSRLCKWLSLDPLMDSYPSITAFAFSFNNPISYNDPDGKDPEPKAKKVALAFWGGARTVGDNGSFSHAAINTQKSYGSFYNNQKFFAASAKFVVDKINEQEDNSIGRLDLLTHAGPSALYMVRNKNTGKSGLNGTIEKKDVQSNNLYTNSWIEGTEGIFNGPDSRNVTAIDFNKFTSDAVVEVHGCKVGQSTFQPFNDNLAENLSEELYTAGKTEAVVIAHMQKASPNIKGKKTKENEQDYRHGKRVVYHNGAVLFYTNKKGHIGKDDISKFLEKKEKEGNKYDGSKEELK